MTPSRPMNAPQQAHPAAARLPGRSVAGHLLRHQILALTTQISGSTKTVIFHGTAAKTNGPTIYLPDIHPLQSYPEHDAHILRGYAVHEAAHGRYTDWQAYAEGRRAANRLAARHTASPTEAKAIHDFYSSIANIVDDRFIEARTRRDYAGTTPWIARLRTHSTETRLTRITAAGAPSNIIAAYNQALISICDISNDWPATPLNRQILDRMTTAYPIIARLLSSAEQDIRSLETGAAVHDYALTCLKQFLSKAFTETAKFDDPEPPPEAVPDWSRPPTANPTDNQTSQASHASANENADTDPATGPGPPASEKPGITPGTPADVADPPLNDSTGASRPSSATPTAEETSAPAHQEDPKAGESNNGPQSTTDNPTDPLMAADNQETGPDTADNAEEDAHYGDALQAQPEAPSDLAPIPDTASNDKAPDALLITKPAALDPTNEDAAKAIAAALLAVATYQPVEERPTELDDVMARIAAATKTSARTLPTIQLVAKDPYSAHPDLIDGVIEQHISQLIANNVTLPGLATKWSLVTPKGNPTLDRSDPAEASIARKVRPLLIARRHTAQRTRTTEGALDHHNIVGLSLGDPDVFKQKAATRANNTAIFCLVDQSRSTTSFINLLGRIAYRLCDMNAGLPELRTALATYTSINTDRNVPATLITHVKRFNDTPTAARNAFQTWLSNPRVMHGTPTAEATLAAARHLEPRVEHRRILLTITDGQPDDMPTTIAVNRHLKSRGIETCILEIGKHRLPKTAFDHAAVAFDMTAVPEALNTLLLSLLRGSPSRL